MKSMIKQMSQIFSSSQKFKIFLLLVIIIIGAFMELLGITAILPFINLAIDPGNILKNKFLYSIYTFFNFENPESLIIVLAIFIIVMYIIKNLYIVFMNYLQFKFVYMGQKELACKLMDNYVDKDYLFHVNNNSSDLMQSVIYDSANFYSAVLTMLQIGTELSVAITLIIFLAISDLGITITMIFIFSLLMLIFLKKFKNILKELGKENREYSAGILKSINQSLKGIKEIKVLDKENYFKSVFEKHYRVYADNQRKNAFFNSIPKPVIETACIVIIMFVIILKIKLGGDTRNLITTLSAFALATMRLLPSFNKISGFIGTLLYNKAAVEAIYNRFLEMSDVKAKLVVDNDLKFQKSIKLLNIKFHYPGSEKMVLDGINLNIAINTSIALIGNSGAGKTTLVDIILGILMPLEGAVLVDGTNINGNMHAWHEQLAYIPQNIYLLDDTVRKNIAFGYDEDDINDALVIEALEQAQLKNFVEMLPDGLETIIGEDGAKLSGGQRQRIGIARALYRKAPLLILDEATSALDMETEQAVMEAVNNLKGKKTLIIIAHRLSTIENCEHVYEVIDGKIIEKI